MYIFAVALQDGVWDHVKSYLPERAKREDTVRLWKKIETKEDPYWTKRYHDPDPKKKAFGAKIEILFEDGSSLVEELGLAHAHPYGKKPFKRENYIKKFDTLTSELIETKERNRFLNLVENLENLDEKDVLNLNVFVSLDKIKAHKRDEKGIF